MRSLYYLIGEPGVGKTTLMQWLLHYRIPDMRLTPFALLLTGEPPVIEIGTRRKDFGGTDGLSMSVQPQVVEWIARGGNHDPEETYIAEGDRLANDKFFEAMLALELELRIIHVVAPPRVVEQRRAIRASQVGKQQNSTWLKGRRTKVRGLSERWANYIQVVDASAPLDRQLAQLRLYLPKLWASESTQVPA